MTGEVDALRERWVARSGADRLHRINADRLDWSDEDFLRSGEEDVAREVDPHLHLLARPADDAVALDLGCGVGRLSRALAGRFGHVEGIDISPPMVEEARRFAPPVPDAVHFQVCAGDGTIPLADASVDFVFSFLVLQHVQSAGLVAAYLRSVARVLVPGGVARLQVNGLRRSLAARAVVRVDRSDRVPLLHRKPVVKLEPHSTMGVVFTEATARRAAEHAHLDVLDVTGAGTQHLWVLLRRPKAGPGPR